MLKCPAELYTESFVRVNGDEWTVHRETANYRELDEDLSWVGHGIYRCSSVFILCINLPS